MPSPDEAEALIRSFDPPELLGVGYPRSTEPALSPGATLWDPVSDAPECAPFRPLLLEGSDDVVGEESVEYAGPQPGQTRSILLLVVEDDLARSVLEVNGAERSALASCYERAFRAFTGFADLAMTDDGLGELPYLGVDGVWRRLTIEIPSLAVTAPVAYLELYRPPMLLHVAVPNVVDDAELLAIADDLAARLARIDG